jgi:hypothetical protein
MTRSSSSATWGKLARTRKEGEKQRKRKRKRKRKREVLKWTPDMWGLCGAHPDSAAT